MSWYFVLLVKNRQDQKGQRGVKMNRQLVLEDSLQVRLKVDQLKDSIVRTFSTLVIPKVAVILGSGLGEAMEFLDKKRMVGFYTDFFAFLTPSVAGHKGQLWIGFAGDSAMPVAVLQGRSHMYEGYSPTQVVAMVRLLRYLGVKTFVLTNAAGGISDHLNPGDLALINDHINLMGTNPLIGTQREEWGPQFPDMSEVYDFALTGYFEDCARYSELKIPIKRGVYAGMSGPMYETPSEVRMLRVLGADMVGMSTVPEAIALRQMGARCVGISTVTNKATGLINGKKLSHEEVRVAGKNATEDLNRLFERVFSRLAPFQ